MQEQHREAAALLELEQDAARRAAQHAAKQREEEALAALRAAQQRTSVTAVPLLEGDLEREMLALALPTLEGMAMEELQAAAGISWAAMDVAAKC